jgi:hypothetical protein
MRAHLRYTLSVGALALALALALVGWGSRHTASARPVVLTPSAASAAIGPALPTDASRVLVSRERLVPRWGTRAPTVSDVLCTTSITMHQSFGKSRHGRYALLSWIAEENCPLPIDMRGTSAARTRDGKQRVASGTPYGWARTRTGRSAGGYVTTLRLQHRMLVYTTLKTAPGGMVWAPAPTGLDTRGIDQKHCVGYRMRLLGCTFSRFFTTGVV